MNLLGLGLSQSRFSPRKYRPSLWLDASRGVYQDAAVQFTAADKSWLQIADASQTGLDPGTDDFAISLWYRPDDLSGNYGLAYKGASSDDTPGFLIATNGDKVYWTFTDGTGSRSWVTSATAMSVGAWHHIVLNFDRSGNATLYINGTADTNTLDISGKSASVENAELFIVGAYLNAPWYCNGCIDSLMFFKAADLSAVASDIIAWAYNNGLGRLCKEITPAQEEAWGAVSGYEMLEESGQRHDSWGPNHLVQSGSAAILAAPGIARGVATDSNFAVQLNGSTQYLSYTGTAFNPGVGDFSVGCAFYADRLPDSYGMLLSGGKATTAGSAIYTLGIRSNGAIYAEFNGDSGDQLFFSTVAGIVTAGVWYTLAGSFDRDGNLTIALNGGSPVVLGNIAAKANACSPGQLQIGRWVVASNFFPGRIDNAFYCNRLLSAAEITYLHNTGQWRQWAEIAADQPSLASAMVGFWEGDDKSSLGKDSTPAGNHLTPQGTPTQGMGVNYLAGMVSRWEDQSGGGKHATMTTLAKRPAYLSSGINSRPVVSGDGIDDYLGITVLSLTGGFAIAAVLQCAANPSSLTLIGKAADDYVALTDNTTVTVSIAGTSQAFTVPAIGTDPHILTVTRDTANAVRVYLDGTESTTGPKTIESPLTLEQILANAGGYFAGDIADVLVYDGEKTAAELARITTYLSRRYGVTI